MLSSDDAIKILNDLKWRHGECFRKRSPEDQELIKQATTALSRAKIQYKPSANKKKAAKKG